MKVGLTYDLRQDYMAEGYGEEETAEFDRPDTIDAIENTLRDLGYRTDRIGHAKQLSLRLAAGDRWDLVFNIAEGLRGLGREALVPALLDAYDIPYTFSDPLVLSLTLHKGATKHVIRDLGIPTPDFAVIETDADLDGVDLPLPVFVKPVAEGTGKGISAASRVISRDDLVSRCRFLLRTFKQPVLVETFLPGREFTVGIVGTGARARAVGVMEILFKPSAEQQVYSFLNKEEYRERIAYRRVEDGIAEEAERVALDSWRGLGCRDAGRVDLRADLEGKVYFLEVNPLAGLHPEHSDLPILCGLVEMSYRDLISAIMDSAVLRMHLAAGGAAAPPPTPAALRRRVAVLHGEVPADAPEDEQDVLVEVATASDVLSRLGFDTIPVVFSLDVPRAVDALRREEPELVFNLVESVGGRGRLIHLAPAVLDSLGCRYTGAGTDATFMTSNKVLAKRMLEDAGIRTPRWLSLDGGGPAAGDARGRFILKSVWEHASIGLDDRAVVEVRDAADLKVRLEEHAERTGDEVFAEAFIDGREFNLSLLAGGNGPEVLPHAEIRFLDYPRGKVRLVDYKAKWDRDSFEYHHTPRSFEFSEEDRPLLDTLSRMAMDCWRLFGLRGYARVDFRVDGDGRPWVLEVNTNPCLSPDGGFVAAVERAGLDLTGAVERILADAHSPVPSPGRGLDGRVR